MERFIINTLRLLGVTVQGLTGLFMLVIGKLLRLGFPFMCVGLVIIVVMSFI